MIKPNDPSRSRWCEQLYEEKAAQLILYGRALGLSHCEAEDVLQETFLEFLKASDPPAQADHYCVRAFRNRTFNYRRSLWRRLTREFESQHWFESSAQENPRELEAVRGLENLPVEQREVIVLKIWHDFTFVQIANLLELSPNTVAGRYRYGLQKLQTLMKGADNELIRSMGDSLAQLETPTAIPGA